MPNPFRTHTSRSVALLAAALLAAGGCSVVPDDDEDDRSGSGSDLRRYYDQEIEFGACEGRAPTELEEPLFVEPFECAEMTVPLDYEQPDGRTASIGVMRLAAKGDPQDRVGSLVLNPGGPGGSGMLQAAVASVGLKDSEILDRFDVVGFDPRGVGASTPAIDCFSDDERDRGEDQTTLLGSSGEWDEGDTRDLTEGCAEGSGGDEVLASVGTRNAARDLDVLREVLGDDGLTFAGQSYGTRLGAVYAEMFPQNVRAMVLDGVVDPTQGTAERRRSLHAGFQRSFELMAASCAEDRSCPLGTDPSRATEVFQDLVQPLIDDPVPAGDGRRLGFAQATGGVLAGLYFAEQWPAIIAGIDQVRNQQRGDKLLALSDTLGVRSAGGEWNNQLEANYAINCNDEQRRTPEQEAALRAEIAEINPILDTGRDYAGVSRDACEHWPVEPTLGFPYADDVDGLPRTLTISTTGDPATPYEAGRRLATLLDGSLLTVDGERHTVFQAGISPCVNDITASYLIDLEVPTGELRCAL